MALEPTSSPSHWQQAPASPCSAPKSRTSRSTRPALPKRHSDARFARSKAETAKSFRGTERSADLPGLHPSIQPACLSLSQPTEVGTVYSTEESAELERIAHAAGLLVHMDGARISNAAVALGLSFRELCEGADILSFGGMKNGVAFGEAVVVLRASLAARVPYLRKTRLQLASKMRFISAQYEAYLSTGAWERNAISANAAARRLESAVRTIGDIEIAYPVSTNAVFRADALGRRRSRSGQLLFLRVGRRPSTLGDELRH